SVSNRLNSRESYRVEATPFESDPGQSAVNKFLPIGSPCNGTSTTQDLTLAPCAPGAAVVARAREPRRARPGERPLLRRPARQQPSPRARRWRQRYAARCCTRRPPPRKIG